MISIQYALIKIGCKCTLDAGFKIDRLNLYESKILGAI